MIDGEYVKRENLDEYDTLAYSLDALIDIICRDGADCHFYHNKDDDHWLCRWTKCLVMNFAAIARVGKTKVDAAFEVVVALCKEGYIKETMPNDNDLVAIPREEYEQLLYYKETFDRMLDARIHDCKVQMQVMEMETMIAQAIPPPAQVQPLNDDFKFHTP